MATWRQFAEAEPEMAARGAAAFDIPIVYLATVRRDGAPRLHPVCPRLAGDRLYVMIVRTSPKRLDLLHEPRYALHALPGDMSEDYDEFEFNLTGRARRVTDAASFAAVEQAAKERHMYFDPSDWLFELDIAAALTTSWNHKPVFRDGHWVFTGDSQPTRRVWKETH